MSASDKTTLNNVVSPHPNFAFTSKPLTASVLQPLLSVDFSLIPDLTSAVKLTYAVECTDGVNSQIQSGTLNANVARTSGGAFTTAQTPTGTTNTVTNGGMTPTFSWATNGNVVTLGVTVTTNLTPTNFHIDFFVDFATHKAAVSLA